MRFNLKPIAGARASISFDASFAASSCTMTCVDDVIRKKPSRCSTDTGKGITFAASGQEYAREATVVNRQNAATEVNGNDRRAWAAILDIQSLEYAKLQ